MTEDAGTRRDGAVHIVATHERVCLMAAKAEVLRGVGPEHETKLTLVRIMAIRTPALADGFVDKVLHGHDVAGRTQVFGGFYRQELVEVRLRLVMAGSTLALGHRPMHDTSGHDRVVATTRQTIPPLHVERLRRP